MPVPNSNEYVDVPGTGITIILTRKGDTFLIDTSDTGIAKRHCWGRHMHGYATAVRREGKKQKRVYLHRLVCETSADRPHVDHSNGNPADCRSENLRPCDRRENLRNQKRRVSNTSGFKGVGMHQQTGKFRARVNGVHLGLFESAEEASRAAEKFRERMHGEFARHE